MPSLDVNMVLLDPDLADTFDVRRSQEAVGANGRMSVVSESFPDQVGVVKWDAGRTERGPDGALTPSLLMVITPFSLRGASFGYQPDVVIWRGSEYTVMKSKPYRQFGEGFTIAECESTRAADNPAPAS